LLRIPILQDDPNAIPVHPNCGRCPAICCHYIASEIDAPTKPKDFDILRWYLMHPGVRVFVEDNTNSWFVQFMTRCRFLRPDNRCGIYETRPQICRDLDPTQCEFALGPGDRFLFTNLEEFDRWLAERDRVRAAAKQKRTKRRRRRVVAIR
jgi:Fe-S-cluster containining protein